MNTFSVRSLTLAAAFLLCALDCSAQIVVALDTSDGERRQRREIARQTTPASQIALPYYFVDTTDPAGPTTLFAIRNPHDEAITVFAAYYPNGSTPFSDSFDLGPHDTLTVNVRDLGLPETDDGVALGRIVFNTGPSELPIYGDYFQVDPGNDLASGGALSTGGCTRLATRFARDGVFDATRFSISTDAAEDLGDGSYRFADGIVYDEDGNEKGALSVISDHRFGVLLIDTDDIETSLPGLLGPFGSIEWSLAGDGSVTGEIAALGRFSVGVEATCLE